MSVSNSPDHRIADEETRDLGSLRQDDSQGFTVCPPNDRLAQLVSGSLAEAEAEQLLQHIDACSSCQKKADELARRRDPVLAAAQDAKGRPAEDFHDPMLSRLIREAQIAKADSDTQNTHATSTTKTVSAEDFVNGLRRCGLMADGEVNQVLSEISWGQAGSNSDVSSLAKMLVEHRKLTPFQAKLLLRGRWQGLVLGNYAILEKLGQGGMGAVFKARHTRMGRIVCLKVVNAAGRQSPAVIERFRNEARTLAALSHPNIVVAHDANESKGVPYLVMEYVDGDDLAKRVRREGPLQAAEALDVITQTASALQYAHAAGVIHRDIKPHNLVARQDMATGKLSVKVLDLGLARFDTLMTNNPDASVLAAMTHTGVVIGTVDYMAPEQALDSRNADARSDIYSLGCTMYFLLTGRPPYLGETVMQRLIAHREQLPPSLCEYMRGGITPALDAVVQKMLAKDPDARYQTMNELLSDLHAVAAGRQPSATPVLIATPAPTSQPPPPPASSSVASQVNHVSASGVSASGASLPPEPSIFDIRVEEQTAQVVSQILTRRRQRKNIPWYQKPSVIAPIAAALILIVVGTFMLIPRTGAATAIRNGGDGRALIVVSSDKFDEKQFHALTKQLTSKGVNFSLASPNYGTGEQDFGTELKAPYHNMRLEDVDAKGFDHVFMLHGNVTQLTRKNPETNKVVVAVIKDALDNGLKITGCNDAYHEVLKPTGLPWKPEYKDMICDACNAEQLVSKADERFTSLRGEEIKQKHAKK